MQFDRGNGWLGGLLGMARKGLGLALVLAAVAGTAQAGFQTPEMDPGSVGSAVALLAGGLLLLTDRLRRK